MTIVADQIITGERFQALADVTVLTDPILRFHQSLPQSGVRTLVCFPGGGTDFEVTENGLNAIRQARSIFVYTHLLDAFFTKVLPRLTDPFVLLSHNSDEPVDVRFQKVLDDPRLLHWFAQNVRLTHPKLTAVPIGIANAQWGHGNTALVAATAMAGISKMDAIYCNFEQRTNPALREPLMRTLRAKNFVSFPAKRPFAEYLRDLAGFRWCVSPPGNGFDCHRTWEALYVGSIPIVQRAKGGLFDGLPAIELEDLASLTVEHLLKETQRLAECRRFPEKLTLDYWRRRLDEALATD